MKALFGILTLLVVLAIVGIVAKRQLQAPAASVAVRGGDAASAAEAMAGDRRGAVADPSGLSSARQARDIEERARAETARALQQGADRNAQADP